jgi:adenosine deaminase
MNTTILEKIKKLPKIDLHRHLDGSVRVETVRDAATKHNFTLPTTDLRKLKRLVQVSPECSSLTEFLKAFEFFYDFLKYPDVVERIAFESCEDARKENIRYLELRFAPPLQATKNFSEEEVVRCAISGVKEGMKKFGIKVGLILCVYRSLSEEQNWATVKLAEKYFGDGVVGIDLAGDESRYDVNLYKKFFNYIVDAKIPITCHAGEGAGAESIKNALILGANRIGHGVRLYEDQELMRKVRDLQIPLEICLTSNKQTQVVKTFEDHPFKMYYDFGIKVTLNTDDPSVSGIDINHEYILAQEVYKLTIEDLKKIVLNGIESAFLPKKEKMVLINEIKKELEII